jgi:hypothetical protein
MAQTTTRRAALMAPGAALLSAVAIAAAVAPAGPDAGLIADCHAFIAWEHRVLALYTGPGKIEEGDERDAAEDTLQIHQRPLLDRICATPATTLEGARAKGAALATWAPDHLKPPTQCWDERLLASLLADLIGEDRP